MIEISGEKKNGTENSQKNDRKNIEKIWNDEQRGVILRLDNTGQESPTDLHIGEDPGKIKPTSK